MPFLIAIALAIPTYGLSLILLLVYLWFKHGKIIKNIPCIIDSLSKEDDFPGICVDGLNFSVLLGFAKENGKILSESRDFFEFITPVEKDFIKIITPTIGKGKIFSYKVTVRREHKTSNSIVSASKYIYIKVDNYTATKVPIELYYYWSGAGIDDCIICEMYVRNMTHDLNIMAEVFSNGGTMNDFNSRCNMHK